MDEDTMEPVEMEDTMEPVVDYFRSVYREHGSEGLVMAMAEVAQRVARDDAPLRVREWSEDRTVRVDLVIQRKGSVVKLLVERDQEWVQGIRKTWTERGYRARVFHRSVRADGEDIPVWVLVVRERSDG